MEIFVVKILEPTGDLCLKTFSIDFSQRGAHARLRRIANDAGAFTTPKRLFFTSGHTHTTAGKIETVQKGLSFKKYSRNF